MIALVRFKVAAYVRSHRVIQSLLPIFVLLSLVYATRTALGQESAALTDSAVLLIPFLAWAARNLLDTEPDEQRLVSATAAGGPAREPAAGLLAALAVTTAFAALALAAGLLVGMSATPSGEVVAAGLALHLLAALTGTALGALTSRPILPSPALSIMTLFLGFLAMLLVSTTPAPWLTVPVIAWMRSAGAGHLLADLPLLAVPSLLWPLVGILFYLRLRRARP